LGLLPSTKIKGIYYANGTLIRCSFAVGIASGISCAAIASVRGVDVGGWFVLGLLLSLPAILFVSIAQPSRHAIEQRGLESGTHKKCDYCAEAVKSEAVKCRHCASPLEVIQPPEE
jgi:hypothetical protein